MLTYRRRYGGGATAPPGNHDANLSTTQLRDTARSASHVDSDSQHAQPSKRRVHPDMVI